MVATTQPQGASSTRAPALSREGAAIVVAAAGFVVALLVGLLAFWGRSLPIDGPGSLSQTAALVAAVVALGAYLGGRWWPREGLTPFRTGARPTGVDVFDTVVIAFAHAVIALLGWVALGAVLADGFQDARVYWLAGSALAGAVGGVTAYAAFLSAAGMSLLRLSTVLAVFAIVGLLASMLSAPDPHWWQLHLSALGMSRSISSLTFNLTLIVAGVIVTAIARYATDARGIADPRQHAAALRIRVCLILIGVLLAGVGVFPLNVSMILHNVSAVGMLLTFSLVVFWVRAAVPRAPQSFFILGYVFFATIVVMAVFYVTGYYVLTATELVAGVLVFAWLIVYLRIGAAAWSRAATDDPATGDPGDTTAAA